MRHTTSKKVSLTVGSALLKQIDEAAIRNYTSRSGIVREALLQYIRDPNNNFDPEQYLEDLKKEFGLY